MRLLLGVGGGIAAYKSAELLRAFQAIGFEVQVLLTKAAEEFVRPLTFAALSGRKVITSLFPESDAGDSWESAIEHIALAQEHSVLVIAPATADLLAKLAGGHADDFLTTLYLAFRGPVILAPAMNTNMWEHPATQANIELLRQRHALVLTPDSGLLACGAVGPGRMPDPQHIASFVADYVSGRHAGTDGAAAKRDLVGDTVLITVRPTQERIDPVRFISNRSSGKMGYALAEEARGRGAQVILVSGPVYLASPAGVELVSVETAGEMRDAVLANLSRATVVIKAAAVSDYHVSAPPQRKLKKTATRLSLELDPTPDILAELGNRKRDYLLIGFAAETEDLLDEARRKMVTKNCDMVVANLVGRDGTGFEADQNEVDILMSTGEVVHAGPADKAEIAREVLNQVAHLRLSLHAASHADGKEERRA